MEMILLVFASFAALAFGVLSAYGACIMLFALVRMHAVQTTQTAASSVQPVSA